MHTIIVTDGEERASLALARALGGAGHRVVVCAHDTPSLAGASRFCWQERRVAAPVDSPESFVAGLRSIVAEVGADTLIPVTEAALLAVLANRQGFGRIAIPFPPIDTFLKISDKRELLRVACEAGIAVPAQFVVQSKASSMDIVSDELPFPLVVKPARSVVPMGEKLLKLSVAYAETKKELSALLSQYPDAAYPLLLQQRVNGPGIGVFLLLWNGKLMASLGHRRLREKPPSGGVSVYRESIGLSPTLRAQSQALLDQFSWQGVAMIEYKVDAASGTPYLMEINGRFWGSLQLALDAGVDFPNTLVALAHGEPVHVQGDYRQGVRSRWWWGDVDQLIARFRKSDHALGLPPGSTTRLGAVLDFLVLWRPGDRNEILRLDDPLPFLRETVNWVRRR